MPEELAQIDPTTGLYELPEGYRWKVSFGGNDYEIWDFVTVSLQKKGRWGWKSVDHHTFDLGSYVAKLTDYEKTLKLTELVAWRGARYVLYDPSEYPKLILLAAGKVLISQQNDLDRAAAQEKITKAQTELAGLYPPKSL